MDTASAAGWQLTTTRANVARQIKDQRRSYARAVLRTLARTQQHRLTAQVQRLLRDTLTPLGCACRPLPCTSSPRTSPLDAPSTWAWDARPQPVPPIPAGHGCLQRRGRHPSGRPIVRRGQSYPRLRRRAQDPASCRPG